MLTNSTTGKAEKAGLAVSNTSRDQSLQYCDALPVNIRMSLRHADYQISPADVYHAFKNGMTEEQLLDGLNRLQEHIRNTLAKVDEKTLEDHKPPSVKEIADKYFSKP